MLKSREEILGFDDRKMMLIGIPIISLMINAILFGDFLRDGEIALFGRCHLIAFLYTAFYWFTFREIHYFFIKKFQGYHGMKKRYIRMIPTVIIGFVLIKGLLILTIDPLVQSQLIGLEQPNDISEVISTFLMLVLILTIYESKYLAFQLRSSLIEKEKLIKENISSQLEGLRNQVNPHFLFNSLNTLTSIIPEDSNKAVRFVTKLSKVYRYILEIRDKKVIPLKEELDFIHSYSFLLKERFGDNIHIDIKVPDDQLDKFIIPLSMQITFENAIKHNIISKDMPLNIEVFVKDDQHLVVKNNLQKKSQSSHSTKVGLQNIKNRYSFFTDTEVNVISTVKHFIVTLPLLRAQ
jgi:two-component system LytT family sensor kinase